MSKVNFAPGSSVFYKNEEYLVVKPIDHRTITIQSLQDKQNVINVLISDVHSSSHDEKYNIERHSDKEWKQANAKYEIIKDLVFRSRTKIEVEEQAEKYNKGTNTIYAWIRTYEATGKRSSLISKKTGRKGSRLDAIVDKIIDDIIEVHYLSKQKTSFPKIYRLIKQECKKNDLPAPHANTVRNRIKAVDPKLSMKKREGYKKAHQAYNNFDGEFPEGNYPLDVIQIDHTPLDIILVDGTHGIPRGRPTLTLAIDVYSRMVAGFYLSFQLPGYFNVSQCLYHSLMPKESFLREVGVEGEWNVFGIPRVIHVDNGQDLVGSDMQKVCDELDIELMKRPVANPQFGAHVERLFRTINDEIHNLKGTTFSNVQQKGDYDSAKQATFTLEFLKQWLTQFIVNIYHKRLHHGIGTTPENKYNQGIFGDDETPGTGILPARVENEEHFKVMLLQTFYRSVQKNGITLDGITYYSDILRTWINSKEADGTKKKFKIKRDPLNIQKIYFYDPEIEDYFEIVYRKMHAPKMTLWDMNAAKRYLKDKNISNYSEDEIFAAYDVLARIETNAETVTKKNKLRKNKSIKMTDLQKESPSSKPSNDSEHLADLFNNIQIYKVHEKQQKDK